MHALPHTLDRHYSVLPALQALFRVCRLHRVSLCHATAGYDGVPAVSVLHMDLDELAAVVLWAEEKWPDCVPDKVVTRRILHEAGLFHPSSAQHCMLCCAICCQVIQPEAGVHTSINNARSCPIYMHATRCTCFASTAVSLSQRIHGL